MTPSPNEVTQLLEEWSNGNQAALEKLMPLVYAELHRLAHGYMRHERPGHTLQTSGLVNEACLKLIEQSRVQWQNRAHFFGIAAQIMRRVLVDHARSRQYAKHGGGGHRVSFDDARMFLPERGGDVVALDEALTELATFDARKSQIVELRFFGGLSIEETADVLQVSPGTVMRDWTLAKAWLRKAITGDKQRIS
jgi:RNA polymerase sigma-70 factor (ECF subfamily)